MPCKNGKVRRPNARVPNLTPSGLMTSIQPTEVEDQMQILIADDETVIRRLICKYLQDEGYPILQAKNGRVAWEIYQQERPSLIITDWEMPHMNGIELCNKIRQMNEGSPLQPFILMLTSRSTAEDLAVGFYEAKANEFIRKPVERIELLARFRAGAENMALRVALEAERSRNEQMSLTDSLTGLLNRRALMKTLLVDEDRSRRAHSPMAVILADIDRFKKINDEFGHTTGDKVLQFVAQSMQASVRTGDHVGRWGGEEFLFILPNTDIIQAAEVAERCRTSLVQQQIEAEDGRMVRVSASFGVASADGVHRPPIMDLVGNADTALYWAKDAGRNRVKIYVASADPKQRKMA
jgi:diguanylate cyclase (GGDEF)-like protein